MSADKFHFFYGGPFSQWHPCKFVVNGVTYNCTEQYMMAQKALIFGDTEVHTHIMATSIPSKQKALGRKVKKFNVAQWNLVCQKIVYDGNYAKFTQNEDLKNFLLETGDKEIVEASHSDIIWGIGIAENDPRRFNKSRWRGRNLLGETLVAVRNVLRKENELPKV